MTKLPRNVDGATLVKRLRRLGFVQVHRTGSHIIVRCDDRGRHTETIPAHKPLKAGTLSSILGHIARYLSISRDELLDKLGL